MEHRTNRQMQKIDLSGIDPVKSLFEPLQYANGFHAEEPEKNSISYSMRGVKPYTTKLSHNKSLKGERINEGCPEKDIHYPAKDITPDNAKDYKQLCIQFESPEIG